MYNTATKCFGLVDYYRASKTRKKFATYCNFYKQKTA